MDNFNVNPSFLYSFLFFLEMASFLENHRDIGDEERVTVTAYVHNVEKLFPDEPFYNIPDLILFICMAYYYDPEGWDPKLCDEKIKIEKDTITVLRCSPNHWYSSISMKKYIEPKSGIHTWTFRIDNKNSSWHVLGIWKLDKEFERVYKHGYGYVLSEGFLANPNKYGSFGRQYGIHCKNNDVIEMIVDMDKLCISYKVNDQELGIAFKDIEETKYKAGLTTCYENTQFTFLSYTNLRNAV